jgi:methyl-accepting chemotaxis protein
MNTHENGNGAAEAQFEKRGAIKKIEKNDVALLQKIKNLERALKQNEMALEQAVDSVIIINTNKVVTFFNAAAERTFGFSRSEVLGQNAKFIVPMNDHDPYMESDMQSSVNKSVGVGRELELSRKDGSKFWGNLTISKVQIGEEIQYTAFIKDISEQKKVLLEQEQLQRELETRMNQINVACIVSESDLKGNILYVNDKLCEVAQYTREECIGQPHSMFRHPDMPKETFKDLWATIGKGKIFRGIIKNRKKDGSPYWVDALIAPVLGANGKPVKYIGVRYDITDTVLKQEELEGQMTAINSSSAYIEFKTDGTVIKANDLFLRCLKYREGEIEGKHHRIFCDTNYTRSNEYIKFWENLRNGIAQVGEVNRLTKDGTELWLQATYTPVKDNKGNVVKIIKLATDVTEQKIKDQQFKEQVTAISKVILQIAKGDLTDRVSLNTTGDIQIMADALNDAIDNINNLLLAIGKNADVVASSSVNMLDKAENMKRNTGEVASAVSQMAKGAQDQATRTDESSKLVVKVKTSADDMEQKANAINSAAEKGQKGSENGLKTMKVLVTNMTGIRESAQQTSKSIEVLTHRAEEIGRTLKVITDIASQTNLLALNAAIEAARAGDAGRGFAVVAEEIRKLAEDSRKSAVDIEKIIGDVQKDTVSAGKAIDTMQISVKEGGNATNEAESIFQEITASTQSTFEFSKQIQDAAKDQKSSIDLVVKNIEQIVVVAEETAAGTQQAASSSQQLSNAMSEIADSSNKMNGVAKELQAGVDKFKLRKVI